MASESMICVLQAFPSPRRPETLSHAYIRLSGRPSGRNVGRQVGIPGYEKTNLPDRDSRMPPTTSTSTTKTKTKTCSTQSHPASQHPSPKCQCVHADDKQASK